MGEISILDATLRDGGCVIDFNFGNSYMRKILAALEASNVDYIELGYIDSQGDSTGEKTKYKDEKIIYKKLLDCKKTNLKYVAMIDYGKYDIDLLEPRNTNGIDGIRMAFHKKDWKKAVKLGRKIISKGYKFYIQPMITLRYSDKELLELIEYTNEILPDVSGFYIVDSFGEMRGNDVIRMMHIIDRNLDPSISLGFHSHNNLQLSYANAMSFLEFATNRDIILDSCVMGMGKGAGNLNTELLMEHMNLYYGKNYKISPLLKLIDTVINSFHYENYWGYAAQYYLSAVNQCSPTYAAYYYEKQMLTIEEISEILQSIPEEKKISFDREFAEKLYRERNTRKKIDDSKNIEMLLQQFADKDVLMIAPGKSIIDAEEMIRDFIKQKRNLVVVTLNHAYFDSDYIIVTRQELMDENKFGKSKKIVLSNLKGDIDEYTIILDYNKWSLIIDDVTYDSSGIIGFNLMKEFKVRTLYLAGFDGYSLDIKKNYYNYNMRKSITEDRVSRINEIYHDIICKMSRDIDVQFITKSLYE